MHSEVFYITLRPTRATKNDQVGLKITKRITTYLTYLGREITTIDPDNYHEEVLLLNTDLLYCPVNYQMYTQLWIMGAQTAIISSMHEKRPNRSS